MVTGEQHKPVALAFIVNQIRPQGPIFVIRDIVRGLPRGRYRPYIIQLCTLEPQGEAMADELQSMGCEILSLGFTKGQLELCTRSAARLLDECLRRYQIRIVHSHTYHPDLVTRFLTRQYIVLTTQHNVAREDFAYGKGLLLGRYMYHRLLWALSRHRNVVGVSQVCRDFYRKRLPNRVNVYSVPNGIDNTLFAPCASSEEQAALRRALDLPADHCILTMSGSLSCRKDPMTVLRAMRRLKRQKRLPERLTLLLLGQGDREARCRRLAKPLGGQVRFIGFTHRVADYLKASNALITASRSEGFGLNVIEGGASGCVVIHSDLPIFDEILSALPDTSRLRFPVKNVNQCAECILKAPLMTFDRQDAVRFGEYYSNERMALQYHRIYQQLLRQYLK